MKVFRIEHRVLRFGPYRLQTHSNIHKRSERFQEDVIELSHYLDSITDCTVLPTPWNDFCNYSFIYDDRSPFVFGCPCEQTIERWFNQAYTDLHRLGFVLRIYEVADAHVKLSRSGTQVAFDKRKAKLIDTRNLLA